MQQTNHFQQQHYLELQAHLSRTTTTSSNHVVKARYSGLKNDNTRPSKVNSLIPENNTITMRDRKINFRSLILLDQPIFLITFDQFMKAPLN